ncbi:MAG TPA: DapH/DapD/GlmU-related protein [Polyangiaceae bacterium LLY-WYZ-14_1]|nr:DapH/DapD/GlmU-related protein [Polyangiaceae bacterium LLY-WYZ-14_1]
MSHPPSSGISPEAFVHPTAVVDDGVELGAGAKVWHFVHVCANARVGARCVLGQNVFVGPGVSVGDGVKVQNNVSLYAGVTVEADVFLGPSCVFTNVNEPRAFIERKHEFKETRVGRGATVGANATIVCGHDLGTYCFVGAGAVVTRDVPDFALVVGVPATRVGWVCRCGRRLPDGTEEPSCAECGCRYWVAGEGDAARCALVDGGSEPV